MIRTATRSLVSQSIPAGAPAAASVSFSTPHRSQPDRVVAVCSGVQRNVLTDSGHFAGVGRVDGTIPVWPAVP